MKNKIIYILVFLLVTSCLSTKEIPIKEENLEGNAVLIYRLGGIGYEVNKINKGMFQVLDIIICNQQTNNCFALNSNSNIIIVEPGIYYFKNIVSKPTVGIDNAMFKFILDKSQIYNLGYINIFTYRHIWNKGYLTQTIKVSIKYEDTIGLASNYEFLKGKNIINLTLEPHKRTVIVYE